MMAATKSNQPFPLQQRKRKGTLPLRQNPLGGTLKIEDHSTGTAKLESEFTKRMRYMLSKARVAYPEDFNLAAFISSIEDIAHVPANPAYLRIKCNEGSICRCYTVSNDCGMTQQQFFSVFPWHEVDGNRRVGLIAKAERLYVFPEK